MSSEAGGGPVSGRELGAVARRIDSGRLKEAQQLLRRILKRAPGHAQALKLRGDCLRLAGRTEEALASYEQAVQADPRLASAYCAAGLACEAAGRLAEASGLYHRSSELDPTEAEPLFYLGRVLKALGEAERAIESYRRALDLQPEVPAGHVNLGNLALQTGRLELAEAAFRQALALDDTLARAHCNLAMTLRRQGRLDGALEAARRAIDCEPGDAESLSCLGSLEKEFDATDRAVEHCRRAVELSPRTASYHFNLGEALRSAERSEDAAESYLAALRLVPDMKEALSNLAVIREEQGQHQDALELWTRALRSSPGDPAVQTHLSRLYETMGRLGEAWDLAEAGFAAGQRVPDRRFAQPRWDGEPLDGRRLLVWREQGLGDEIRFASCYPDLLAETGGCLIEADPRLVPIFARSFPAAEIRPDSSAAALQPTDFDCQIPAGSLRRLYRRSDAAFPRQAFLTPDPDRTALWRTRLEESCPGLKVGLCWRSGRVTRERAAHYARLADMAALLRLPDVNFVLLQYDDCADELAEAERAFGARIARWPDLDLKDDLEDLFALVSGLDLVVSATTAVADMAGAVQTPAWVFFSGAPSPDYEAVSRWYGSRLIGRQWQQPWSELFARLADELGGEAGESNARASSRARP